jgi:uncharacterized 2Fe-2S/4Fe-4S cluster protein (DUF4445 family)
VGEPTPDSPVFVTTDFSVPAEESATGEAIAISETDIEGIIRAKAVIYSGTSLMLERLGLAVSDLRRIHVAGSFGRFLDLEQATLIGMLPDVPSGRFPSAAGVLEAAGPIRRC